MPTLKELQEKRNKLLKKAGLTKKGIKDRELEKLQKKRLMKEIKALENPKSTAAKQALKSFGKKAGAFIQRRSDVIARNLASMDEKEKPKKKSKKSKKRNWRNQFDHVSF